MKCNIFLGIGRTGRSTPSILSIPPESGIAGRAAGIVVIDLN